MKNHFFYFCLMLCVGTINVSLSAQDFVVLNGGSVYVKNNSYLSVTNLDVKSGGILNVYSDATNSSSLLVNGTSAGAITYERYVGDIDWHIFSAPVTSQTIDGFATNAGNGIAKNTTKYAIGAYNNTNVAGQRWEYYTDATAPGAGNFASGKGYAFKRSAAGVYSFTGEVATSDANLTLNTSSGGHFWHAVGNPFTAFLPANTNANATNVLGQNIASLDASYAALYLWDGAAYVPVNQLSASLHLAPGQAFMVRVKDASENFTFSKTLANHQSGTTTLYKGELIPGVRLNLQENSVIKTTSIKFLENATLGLDVGYDAGAYQDVVPTFAINTHLVEGSQNIDFALQALPDNNFEELVVPLSVYAEGGKTIRINAIGEVLPEGVNLFIEDRILNTITRVDETTGYEVTLSESVAGMGRFFLHTSTDTVLSIEDIPLGTINIFTTDNNTLKVRGIDPGKNTVIALYSLLGKKVFLSDFVSKGNDQIALPKSLSTGVYIVKLVVEDNFVTRKKIIIK